MNFKLGFGPMSREIVDIIADYTVERQQPLMLIASRNQIDANSGYVMKTAELTAALSGKDRTYLQVCRDHCGPYFNDSERDLHPQAAVDSCQANIAVDLDNGFDLIHVDTSRINNGYDVADRIIKFTQDINPNVKFEFGTEENIGVAAGIERYRADVEFAKNYANMEFVVAQTGSLCFEDRQSGTFDAAAVSQLVSIATEAGVRLKEHNADYLTTEQILLRHTTGVHAMNIAPQLGVVQTMLLRRLCHQFQIASWTDFLHVALASKKWSKWTTSQNPDQWLIVGGHYSFATDEYKRLIDEINQHVDFHALLKTDIERVLDTYVNAFN